jgi:hypothetical protein
VSRRPAPTLLPYQARMRQELSACLPVVLEAAVGDTLDEVVRRLCERLGDAKVAAREFADEAGQADPRYRQHLEHRALHNLRAYVERERLGLLQEPQLDWRRPGEVDLQDVAVTPDLPLDPGWLQPSESWTLLAYSWARPLARPRDRHPG